MLECSSILSRLIAGKVSHKGISLDLPNGGGEGYKGVWREKLKRIF